MRILFSFLALFMVTLSLAQSKGTITGVLTDKDMNNETLPFANVMIKGTTIGATTDEDGKYTLSVPAGTHTVVFSFLGYETETETITIKSGETIKLNKALGAGSVQIDEVILTATVNREKESALLLEQKGAVEIKQSIGAQEMSRKGVSDVAAAVVKTSGVTKQEGSNNIFVRGLGDRYNSTSMNGLPIPSNDPEKKNIALDLFSTDIVESVSIDKVYSNKIYGDFGGASVDIISKDFKGDGLLKIDVGSVINTNAVSRKDFQLQQGYNNFGFSNKGIANNALNQYTFSSLNTENFNPIGKSFGLTAAKSFKMGEQSKLSFFATASHSNDYSARNNGTAKGGVNGNGSLVNKNFHLYDQLNYNTNSTAMGTVNYKINSNHKVSLNSVFVNASSLSREEYHGYVADLISDGNGFIRRNKYEQNRLTINQLLSEHKFTERIQVKWGVSYNKINGDMPDRTQNVFKGSENGYLLSRISRPDNHRYYQNLVEDEYAANVLVDFKIGKNKDNEYLGKITFGYSGKDKLRNFEATQFNLRPEGTGANVVVDPNKLDSFYNQNNFQNGLFSIYTFRGDAQTANALKPQYYKGYQNIQSGFVSAEYKLNPKLFVLAGVRLESIYQKVSWNTQISPEGGKDILEKNAFLPNLIAKYELNEKQNLRLGASKTYTLPQFKERAMFLYEEVNEVKQGNKDLYASDNYNADLKWEMFPSSDEIISIGGFGKYIQNPINEVTISSSTNDISFINTGNYGTIYGIEAEAKVLLFKEENTDSKKLTAGFNGSLLKSNQELDSQKVQKETTYDVVFTHKNSGFTGASNYLLNLDLSFFQEWNNKESNFTGTIAYTLFSDRIYALGTNDRGDLVDKSFGTLDLIAKLKLNKHLSSGLSLKNITNPTIDRVQENSNGDVNVLSYKRGSFISLNINYTF